MLSTSPASYSFVVSNHIPPVISSGGLRWGRMYRPTVGA